MRAWQGTELPQVHWELVDRCISICGVPSFARRNVLNGNRLRRGMALLIWDCNSFEYACPSSEMSAIPQKVSVADLVPQPVYIPFQLRKQHAAIPVVPVGRPNMRSGRMYCPDAGCSQRDTVKLSGSLELRSFGASLKVGCSCIDHSGVIYRRACHCSSIPLRRVGRGMQCKVGWFKRRRSGIADACRNPTSS